MTDALRALTKRRQAATLQGEIRMRFARIVFLVAGIYGLIVLLPQYFLERKIGEDTPPPITHPEFFYGFLGVTIAWQVLFIVLARDPVRFRPMMIPAILEKIGFPIAAVVLFLQGRVSTMILAAAGVDSILCLLFIIAFRKTAADSHSR
jgi:hypothetical protein